MKSFIPALLVASASFAYAAPANMKREMNLGGFPGAGLLGGAGAPAQDATAGLFGAGDAILNGPGQLLSSGLGALTGGAGGAGGAGPAAAASNPLAGLTGAVSKLVGGILKK